MRYDASTNRGNNPNSSIQPTTKKPLWEVAVTVTESHPATEDQLSFISERLGAYEPHIDADASTISLQVDGATIDTATAKATWLIRRAARSAGVDIDIVSIRGEATDAE